ncbi:hypothetical protein [Helicobacter sp. 23-1045]
MILCGRFCESHENRRIYPHFVIARHEVPKQFVEFASEAKQSSKNNNMDCHDFATQNLAMTKKIKNSLNLMQKTHPLAPSAMEGEQIAKSDSFCHCEAV